MMSDDKNQLINFEFDIFNFSDFFKIIRSNFILILYNFIESSVTLFIREIYTKFEFEDISYAEASECFKNLYLEHLFSDTFQEEANFKTYKNKAIEMVRNTLDNICLNFSINKIPSLSGNVSSKLIQKIWNEHGIKYKSSSKCQDPNSNFSIDTIKNKRNSLAHGDESFRECGGKYTVNDLDGFAIEIIKLLDDLLTSVEKFIDLEGYKENKK